MQLRPQFDAFLKDIRPGANHKEDWKVGSRTLRSRLSEDDKLAKIIVSDFLQGSVRRSTAVRPTGGARADVDLVIVTTIDTAAEAPQSAMDRFKPFLDKYYKGKWKPQDRSFAIELSYVDLDLVVTAIPKSAPNYQKLVALYKSESVQTTHTLEEDSTWRLTDQWRESPSLYESLAKGDTQDAPESDWKPYPLLLPDRAVAKWGPTHPLAQIAWTSQKNRRCNGHYVNVVKCLKWWRIEHADSLPKYPKGYPLEHLIGQVLPDGIESVAEGVTAAFEGIRDRFRTDAILGQVPVLPDHGVPSHNVLKRITPEDFQAFHHAASQAATLSREALASDDASKSADKWIELFGNCFPRPGPSGGDRSGGFTPPSGPAKPRPTERFAYYE